MTKTIVKAWLLTRAKPSPMSAERKTSMNPKMQGQIRHLLTTVGGVLVALGYVAADDVMGWTNTFDQVAGPVFVLIGFVWSLFAPEKA